MLKDFNFVYFVDSNKIYINIFKKSVETLIKFYDIHLLTICYDDKDIFYKLEEYISYLKHKYNKNFILQFKYIDTKIALMIKKPKNAINKSYLGNNALIRFYLPYILECDNVFWVDCDILFNNKCEHLKDIDQSNTLLKCWKGHQDEKHCALNNGFMYINCKMWRNIPNIMIDVLKFYIDNHESIRYMNQSCYEYLITEKYKELCILENNKLINVYIKSNTILNKNVYIYHCCGDDKINKMNNGFFQIMNN